MHEQTYLFVIILRKIGFSCHRNRFFRKSVQFSKKIFPIAATITQRVKNRRFPSPGTGDFYEKNVLQKRQHYRAQTEGKGKSLHGVAEPNAGYFFRQRPQKITEERKQQEYQRHVAVD